MKIFFDATSPKTFLRISNGKKSLDSGSLKGFERQIVDSFTKNMSGDRILYFKGLVHFLLTTKIFGTKRNYLTDKEFVLYALIRCCRVFMGVNLLETEILPVVPDCRDKVELFAASKPASFK